MLNPLLIVFIDISCSNNMDYATIQNNKKTIILYIVAENSLANYANKLFHDIQKNCTGNQMDNVNVVLYLDNNNETALYQANTNGLRKVADYDKTNSVKPQTMRSVLHYICEKYPADEMGLILWSHGTGWLPTGNNTRSFGDDNGESIDINDLSTSIFKTMDYIIFDACYMGCIEVVAELSDKANYLILSPGIVPPEGIIDTLSINILAGDELLEKRLKDVCRHYAEENNPDINLPIALVKSSELNNMILTCNDVSIGKFNREVYYYQYRTNVIFYDLGAFLLQKGNNQTSNMINKFIIYHPESLGDITCLSIFLPNENNRNYHQYYSTTKWNIMTNWLSKFGFNQ